MVNIFRKYNHSLPPSENTLLDGSRITDPDRQTKPGSPVSQEEIGSLSRLLKTTSEQFVSVQCNSQSDAALFLLEHDLTP